MTNSVKGIENSYGMYGDVAIVMLGRSGGELLALGHTCPYNAEGYASSECSTYYGEALAIVRAGKPGKLRIHAAMPDGESETEIDVV